MTKSLEDYGKHPCAVCGKLFTLKELTYGGNETPADTCMPHAKMMDEVRDLANAKDKGKITEARFLELRARVYARFGWNQ